MGFMTLTTLYPPDDRDFEVTAEMLIHDTMDDETTLAEEEAHRTKEEDEEELNDLQEVGYDLSTLYHIVLYHCNLNDVTAPVCLVTPLGGTTL